jgi:large subunit ribosomal protein L25
MKELKLKAELREGKGKNFVKKLRKSGEIPCVIYGHGEPALSASVRKKDFEDIIKRNPTGVGVVNLEIKGKETFWSIMKVIQRDSISDEVLHIDFQHLHKGEKLIVDVPVKTSGVPIGEKEGGILEQVAHKIRINVLPSNISSVFIVDVSQLEIGKSIHIKDVDIGDAELEDNPDRVVVHVVTPRVVEEVEPVTEEVEEVEEEEVEGEEKEGKKEEKGEEGKEKKEEGE